MSGADVKAVVDAYETGTRNRDVDLLKTVFHEKAVMSGWLGPDMLVGSPQPFFDFLAANDVAPDYSAETVSMTVTDKIAVVETREANLFGMSFTNHFQLVQDGDGTWKITAKLFRHF